MILDANADHATVKKTLTRLHEKMEELQQRAFTYKSYQKNFKVCEYDQFLIRNTI